MSNPEVSVVIPCYNLGQYIGEAVRSVLAQTFSDFEIIVIDDGSTDASTIEVLSKLSHPKLSVIRSENCGLPAARNTAINNACGTYITCLDADDKFAPTFLEETTKVFRENDEKLGIVTTWATLFGESSSIWKTQPYDPAWLACENVLHVASLFRKSAWAVVGGYSTELSGYQDWDFWISLVEHGFLWEVVEKPLFMYRDRPGSMLKRSNSKRLALHQQIIGRHRRFIQKYSIGIIEKANEIAALLLSERDASIADARHLSDDIDSLKGEVAERDGLIQHYLYEIEKQAEEVRNLQRACAVSNEIKQAVENELSDAKKTREFIKNEYMSARAERDVLAGRAGALQYRVDELENSKTFRILQLWLSSRNWWQKLLFPLKALQVAFFVNVLIDNQSLLRKKEEVETVSLDKWPESLPIVSVIIPCFNYGIFVLDAIQSVKAQTLKNLEIIVIDGGSTDQNTLDTLSNLNDPEVQLYLREGRHFVGDNRNFGIEKAKGKYICCLDADDMLLPTYLEKAVYIAESENADVVYPSVRGFGEREFVWTVNEVTFESCLQGDNISTVAVFKKAAWAAVGGYRDWGVGADHVPEDWDFWLRLLGNGYKVKRIKEPLMLYRIHGSGLTANNKKSFDEQQKEIINANNNLFLPEVAALRKDVKKYFVENPCVNLSDGKCWRRSILIALPFMLAGGADKMLTQTFAYLSSHGYRPIFMTTTPIDPSWGDSRNIYENLTTEIYHLHEFLNSRDDWADFIRYLVRVKRVEILYQVGCEFMYDLMPLLKKDFSSLRIVDQLYNAVGHLNNNRKYKKYIDMTIVENDSVLDILNNTHGEYSKVCLVKNGVKVDDVFAGLERDFLCHVYGIPTDKCVVGYYGRFSSEKGPDIFVDIATKFIENSDLLFIMGGAGPEFSKIQNRAAELNLTNILFPGIVRTNEYLRFTDMVIVPSRIDGRPNVVLEAMASGVPVVASCVGGIPSLLNDGGGYCVDPGDVDGFSYAIRLLKDSPSLRLEVGQKGKESAVKNHSIDRMLESYRSIFDSL